MRRGSEGEAIGLTTCAESEGVGGVRVDCTV
jgi:hypothetical protein